MIACFDIGVLRGLHFIFLINWGKHIKRDENFELIGSGNEIADEASVHAAQSMFITEGMSLS